MSSLLAGVLVAAGVVPVVDAYRFVPGAGWYTFLGSFIFGFGIMLGQGCMVGMLWKAGQGYLVNWLEIAGMMVGTVLFAFPIYNGLRLEWWWHHNYFMSIKNGDPLNYVPNLLAGGVPVRVAALLSGIIFFAGVMGAALWLRRNRLSWTAGSEGGGLRSSPYLYGTLFGLFMVASFVFLAGRGFNYLGVTTPVGLFAEYVTAPSGGC
ncbi:MAG: YeeE/YedE thiosulfate transporter family protein [Acidilobus sp.]